MLCTGIRNIDLGFISGTISSRALQHCFGINFTLELDKSILMQSVRAFGYISMILSNATTLNVPYVTTFLISDIGFALFVTCGSNNVPTNFSLVKDIAKEDIYRTFGSSEIPYPVYVGGKAIRIVDCMAFTCSRDTANEKFMAGFKKFHYVYGSEVTYKDEEDFMYRHIKFDRSGKTGFVVCDTIFIL